MKSLSKKSRVSQRGAKTECVMPSSKLAVSAAIRNRVYTKTASQRPASFRNPVQRVKPC